MCVWYILVILPSLVSLPLQLTSLPFLVPFVLSFLNFILYYYFFILVNELAGLVVYA